jgi:callose synthase
MLGPNVQMADELYDLLDKPTVGKSRIIVPDSTHSFLDRVIKPIHEIVVEVKISSFKQKSFGL